MAEGWQALGQVLGGGVNREKAFSEGQIYSARTQQAMDAARRSRAQAEIQEDIAAARGRAAGLDFSDPNVNLADIILGDLGSNYSAAGQGRLRSQEFGRRDTIADVSADPVVRQAASDAQFGYRGLRPVGSQGFYSADDPTTLQRSEEAIALDEALLGQRGAQARAANELANLREERRVAPERFMSPGGSANRMPLDEFIVREEIKGLVRTVNDIYANQQEKAAARRRLDELKRQGVTPEPEPPTVQVSSPQQVEALPSGSRFIAPDGSVRIKP